MKKSLFSFDIIRSPFARDKITKTDKEVAN